MEIGYVVRDAGNGPKIQKGIASGFDEAYYLKLMDRHGLR
jgi:hypothetical protein